MIHLFEFLRYPIALLFVGYSLYGLLTGSIRVGSRSYTGHIETIRRVDSPGRFYFWCTLFLAVGILCFSVPFIDSV